MKKLFFLILFSVFFTSAIYAQLLGTVKGRVIDAESKNPMVNVTVTVTSTSNKQQTDTDGNFVLNNVPIGDQIIQLSFNGYESQSFPANIQFLD